MTDTTMLRDDYEYYLRSGHFAVQYVLERKQKLAPIFFPFEGYIFRFVKPLVVRTPDETQRGKVGGLLEIETKHPL